VAQDKEGEMIRALLASTAAAALVAATAAAGTPAVGPTATGPAWQLAQAQPVPDAQPPAAGEPAAPGTDAPAAAEQPPAATDQPPADTADTPAGEPSGQLAEEPATEAEPGGVAEAEPETMDTAVFITEQAETHWLATDYIGETVYNRQDESIGSIDDLIVEEDGGLVGFVVGVGGFLGIGKKRVAIDLDAVEFQQDEEGRPKLIIAGTRQALMDAPDFVDKSAQRAERERQEREMQQPPAGAPGGMGGAPGGMGGAPGGTPGQQ
jgi:hypothetical protein